MEPIRFGILSTSSIAPRFIAAVRDAGAGELVALSSRSEEKARDKGEDWDIPRAYGSHLSLLEDKDVNTVYISTVNAQHYPWAKAALEHGKHVICEKPCTVSSAETRALFSLAREKGLFLMEAEKMLFLPAVREVRRRIQRGDLGTVRMAEFRHSFSASYNGWMYDAEAGGGPLLSSGIYVMELLLWLFGPIASLQGVRTALPSGVETQYVLSGQMENGVLFSAENSTRASLLDGAVIYGDRGYAEIPNYWKAQRAVFHTEAGEEAVEYPCRHELVYEAAHIKECLQAGRTESPVVTEALTVAAIEAIERVKAQWGK